MRIGLSALGQLRERRCRIVAAPRPHRPGAARSAPAAAGTAPRVTARPECFEAGERGQAQAAGFEEAAFVHEQDGLIEIDERRPDLVLFADHPRARLREQLDGLERLALLAVRGGGVGQRLRRLVAHARAR